MSKHPWYGTSKCLINVAKFETRSIGINCLTIVIYKTTF